MLASCQHSTEYLASENTMYLDSFFPELSLSFNQRANLVAILPPENGLFESWSHAFETGSCETPYYAVVY
jgi:hypothetical protein